MGADSCGEEMDYENLQSLAESNSVKPTSGCNDVARFGEVAPEAAQNNLKDDKVIDQVIDNTIYNLCKK